MRYIFSEHPSILNQYIAELRDTIIQKDRMRFRTNLERIGMMIAYEISKTLSYQQKNIETPLGIASVDIPNYEVVLSTILRAGLPMHNGMLNIFDHAENAFISAYRKHHKDGSFEVSMDYISSPNLEAKILILSDPMLATGASVDVALKELLKNGTPSQIHIATAVASSSGVDYVSRLYPNAHLWVGAVDEELTAKSYIVPGLGDAGDLSFGEKLQD